MTTKLARTPGRPRRFDPEAAIATAQRLFHARGYDAVSIADLTEAIGIKPPSFYAAFGSKMGLYARVLERYACTGAIPLQALLRADRPVAECLSQVLEEAARLYAADLDAAGCLVVEGTHCDDASAREAACEFHSAAEKVIHNYIAQRHPQDARQFTDYMGTVMAGLSAKSRAGYDPERLLEIARLAGRAFMALK
ncbi:TetR family transcriptional regulator [Superficieibacter electus]|uniref:TetR family transcriptional regulator n=1 Tax=Superficieibacter electus TaxID=2022662 RepID=A0A2P5GNU9_9ENTR|nr:TetR/AcrR family transcriptional regulator [Superficieibacter electus]POP44841.1 TetR family transcriptional regulator [Superficieibacter electus]POP48228.1 TetR family transcriptional regulator [Superficieibacter electus]